MLVPIILLVSGSLWLACSTSLNKFYCSGRYARLEEQCEEEAVAEADNDAEQGETNIRDIVSPV